MKKFLVVGLVLATALALAPAASANGVTFFYFTLTGVNNSNPNGTPGTGATGIGTQPTGVTASGILEGTLVSGTTYQIFYGYDITINGVAASVIPYGNGGVSPNAGANGFDYDNDVNLATSPFFVDTSGGLLFDFSANPADQFLLWFVAPGDLLDGYNTGTSLYNPNSDSDGYDVGMSLSEISPEPPSLLLMGTGLLLMAGLLFWKVKSNTLAPSMNRVV
ncbi:MAG: hypothetical protein ABR907_11025 [Terracidiphilus sp.]|jgi:hypothetical protein